MTANAIVMKLNSLMAGPIDSECKVVYLLCEIRKLMEPTPPRDRPFALNMYAHWALHVDLHGLDTIGPFLQQVDDYVDGVLGGSENFAASHQMARDFVLFDTLRAQLRSFFGSLGVRTELVDHEEWWSEFVTQYAGVIEDGTLSVRAPQGLKQVKEVRFERGREARKDIAHMPFDMRWVVTLLDGRVADIDVNALPPRDGHPPLPNWAISLR